jgi:hypothetical protein
LINGKHGQGTHSTKMGADNSAENTPNTPEFICPIYLPKPKSSGFQWKKASLGVHSLWVMAMKKHPPPSVVTNEKQKLCISELKRIKGVTLVLNLKVLNCKKGYFSLPRNWTPVTRVTGRYITTILTKIHYKNCQNWIKYSSETYDEIGTWFAQH